jgi:hypothetical protein
MEEEALKLEQQRQGLYSGVRPRHTGARPMSPLGQALSRKRAVSQTLSVCSRVSMTQASDYSDTNPYTIIEP